ncbi:MAG TPA: hypothetical protein VGH19_22990 [Verrucomicrobiae bacterium]
MTQRDLNLVSPDNIELLRHIFAAKEVPLSFLNRLPEQKAFHREDWPSVIASTFKQPESFDFYFDYVVELGRRLKTAAGVE